MREINVVMCGVFMLVGSVLLLAGATASNSGAFLGYMLMGVMTCVVGIGFLFGGDE